MKGQGLVGVDVLLATYNGEKFLPSFLKSLNEQTQHMDRLLFRDDGSKDNTLNILKSFCSDNFLIAKSDSIDGNLGVIGNFSCILEESSAQYVLLADQDDVWYPEKIAKSLARIIELEKTEVGGIRPALVFSDLHVVDENLNLVNPSFIKMQGLEKLQQPNFIQLLTQNVAPGCSMIVNRALLDIAVPIPCEAAMHDWWLMLVASLFGGIDYLDEPTVAYRQHGGNQVGAKSLDLLAILKDAVKGGDLYRHRISQAQLQAKTIVARYGKEMRKSDLAAATAFVSLPEFSRGYRQFLAWRHGLKKSGCIRNIGFYCLM